MLVVVQSGCAECGQDAGAPEAAGWIDTSTGTFTPGAPPADAGPCETLNGCDEPTQPVAMTGLCLADGTPISVVVTRDCAGTVTQEGWLNLTTGAWSAGAPPAGTVACGDSRSIQVSGTFCDVDQASGDILGLVLIEYSYAADGSIAGVRLVDAVTGDTYTPQGEVTTCPAGVEQPEQDLIQLCDTAADGTVITFVRDYRRDENGAISGHTDYGLDGTPYTPVGRVGTCAGSLVPCGTGTGGTPGVSGPITSGNEELSSVALARPISAATEHEVPGMGVLITGGTWHMPATKCGVNTSGQDHGLGALKLPAVPRPICDAGTVQVTIRLNYAQEGPDAGQASTGALFLMYHQPDGSAVQAGGHAFPQNTPAGSTGTREVVATIPADRLAAGEVYAVVSAETWQKSFNVPPKCKAWTFSEWSAEFVYDVTGCPDLPPPPLAQLVKVCPTDPIPVTVEPGKDTEVAVLCNTAEDGTVVQFLRAYQVDSESGQVGVVADTLLDGITPYEPLGEVSVCQPEPCASTVEVLKLCDLDPDVTPNEEGKRCAVPFLRHLVHDCTGALVETRDTAMDGTTPYTPVEVVDCGSGGVPALSELLWPQSGIAEDPAGVARQDFIYTITNPQTEGVAEVRLHASSLSPGGCGTYDPAAPVFNNPTTYTLTLDAAAQEMSTFRLDLLDFDTFEGVTGLNPIPSRVEGDVTWNGTTITANVSNITAHVYWDNPPEKISYRYGNTGGGRACSSVAFQGMTLVPGGCCGCGSGAQEPCRDTSSTLLCDTTTTESLTVFDPAGVADADGWQVVSFTGNQPGYGPTGAMPYPVYRGTNNVGQVSYGARPDLNAGPTSMPWPGYDNAPIRWIIRKEFTAPQDGTATITATGFRADGGGRVRINGVDMGLYSQWGQPGVGGGSQAPVTAGPNTIEIEVRDDWGFNWATGRLDIATTRTVQFMRRQVVDCETGEVVATHDTTLDGEPYTVTGEVGQCEPVAECCEQAPPEQRVDIETELLCIRDEVSGDVLGQVVVERIYDDQTGDRLEQRLTDPTTGDPVELPAGAVLARCPSPDRITRQICVVTSGTTEFLTNAGNATTGQDTDWQWAPDLSGTWYPMYEVAPNALWTVTDPAPNKAHWVSPHANKGVCSPNPAAAPNVTATWYTRASWSLPTDVAPETIRIAATVLNADNDVVQWRLNAGEWQPVGGGQFGPPAWSFPPTAVPGGRAGQNEVIVQVLETQPPSSVPCPNGNQAGMILHVVATYDHEPRVWTQVVEDGRVYYLDENGDRQEKIPDGDRIVPCGGGGECCPQPEPTPWQDAETLTLCDIAPDGTSTAFLRHLLYVDGAEAPIVADTALDGTTPYAVAGTADVCPPAGMVACGLDPDAPDSGVTGTITSGTDVDPKTTFVVQPDPASQQVSFGLAASLGGASTVIPAWTQTTNCTSTAQANGWQAVRLPAIKRPACDDGTVTVTVGYSLRNDGPSRAMAGWVATRLVAVSGGVETVYVLGVGGSAPGVGVTKHGQMSASLPAAVLAAGELYWDIRIETRQNGCKSWTVSDVVIDYAFGIEGCANPPQMAQLVKFCEPVTVAPAPPAPENDLVVLCDTDPDTAAVTSFVRNYLRDASGLVIGHADTTLDSQPYEATGTVGTCSAPVAEQCRDSSTLLLCDVPADGTPGPTVTDTAPGPYYPYPTGLPMTGAQALWDGGALTLPPGTGPQAGTTGTVRTLAAKVQGPRPACDTGTAHVAVSVHADQLGPDTGCAITGAVRLFNGATPVATVLPPNNAAVGWSGTLTVEADVPAADLAAGNITFFVALDTYDDSPQACPGTPRKTSWKLSGLTASVAYEQIGCAPQFLRTVTVDCETGAVLTVTDTTLDGDPYTVTGEVGECSTGGGDCCPTEECRDTSTVLLCDLDPECQAGIEPTATDEPNPASFNNWRPGTVPTWCHLDTPGQGAPVWTGGSVVLGPDPRCTIASGGDTHRVIGVHLAAGSPSLTGTVDVTVSLRVTNNGPNPGYGGDGIFALWDASAGQSRIKYVSVPTSAPVGAVYTLTLTAAVPAAALAAGDIVAVLDLETYHGAGPKAWTVDQFTWSAEVPAVECEAQFLRTIVKDCATGATVSVVDTTLDGAPYEVTGDVGQCTPASGGGTPQPDPCQATNVIEACRCDDTDGDGVADTDYVELLAVDCEGALTSIGTYTPDLSAPYVPVAPVPCETDGAPSATGVQARRVELAAGETWSAVAWPTLQSVTAVARGTGTITTADGTSSLVAGESVTWSVARDDDALLTGPLVISADTGTVALSFTTGVTL
ncbi:hypothetical protein [Streptomyces sanglieri]|uniref:hypothetical protein n=1 Tax=Streptomyces sanglieri TaxID=193460 RepID=UPI0035251F1E